MSRQSKQRSSKREDSAKSVRTQGAMSRLLAVLASRKPKEKDPGRDEARARSSKKRCSSADAASYIAYDALYKDGIAEVEPASSARPSSSPTSATSPPERKPKSRSSPP